ncbi:hypothetical protein J5I95_15070 [Candidatus Poribacteria bacterium]|nr:hypothetical protein [Candidatus Poribacteria bacterium]
MLNRLFSDTRLFGAIVCGIVFIAAGLLYLQIVKNDAARDVQRTQERLQQRENPSPAEPEPQTAPPKPPPPGETAESGHWHGDQWHTGQHDSPAEGQRISQEPFADTQVQDVPVIAQQANGQIVAPTQEASPRTQETGKAVYAPGSFGEWLKKDMELSAKEFQLIKKLADVLPDTAEGWEHLRADDQLNREVKRKLDEIEVELGEAVREYNAHQKKTPVGP